MIRVVIIDNNISTAIVVTRDHCQLLLTILVIAHTAVIGAFTNNCSPIPISIST